MSASASASLITYETRNTNNGVDNTDYMASWDNQTTTINSNTLSEFTNITAPGSNYHSRLEVDFSVGTAFAGNDWAFQIAPDAGFGGAMYLDGIQIDTDTSDLWWGFSWGNVTELLTGAGLDITSADHTLEVFWAEGCCNGGQSARFRTGADAEWQALSVANLDDVAVDVSEPASIALFGLGLLGLAGSRKRKA
jgi:hypothetical protein